MIKRNIIDELLDALADSPVVFLQGARQVGKSTLVRSIVSDAFPASYVSLDNATSLAAAKSDPGGFIAGLSRPVILDEVQRVPELILAIKEEVDKDRQKGAFLLTGSASFLTLTLVNESLAGRMEILTLWPLSLGELNDRKECFVDRLFSNDFKVGKSPEDDFNLFESLVRGGFPEVFVRKPSRRRSAWFESYLTAIVDRDVRDIAGIQKTGSMLRLTRLLAARTGTLLNQSELSRSVQIPNATMVRYLELLRRVFLVHFIPAWSTNFGKRLSKSSKVFMVDSGMAAHLIGADKARLDREPETAGQFLETFAVNEVVKQLGWSQTRARPFHLRTHAGLEVDLILETFSGEVAGIEIKKAVDLRSRHFSGLRSLKQSLGPRFKSGVVIYAGSEIVPFEKDLFAVPVQELYRS